MFIKGIRRIMCVLLSIFLLFTSNVITFAAESNTIAIDQMLLKSQQWLNSNYSNRVGFGSIPEDGISRRSTVYGCIRALQIELGITDVADNFGLGTITEFNNHYPNGIVEQEYPSNIESNVYGIVQCALWTKNIP